MRELVPRTQIRDLGIRPQSALGSLIERARLRGAEKTLRAAQDLVDAHTDFKRAIARNMEADLELGRTIRMLKEAEQIYAMDADERAYKRLEVSEKLKDAQLQAQIREMERKRELAHAQALHKNSAYQVPNAQSVEGEETDNQAAKEFRADLDVVREVERARRETEEEIEAYVHECGGWDKVSDAQKERVQRLREKLEKFIKESGFE